MTTTLNKLIEINSKEIEILLNEFISKICHRDDDGEISEYSEQVIKDLIYHLNLILPKSIQSGYELGQQNPIIEKCPNCIEPDENIEPMPDGSCGVCGGKGYIIWKRIGKLQSLLKEL
jgi:hypothetical protein